MDAPHLCLLSVQSVYNSALKSRQCQA